MLNDRQQAILGAARGCLGTIWQHQGRLPGIGLDCIGLLCVVAQALDMPYRDQTDYGRIPRPSVLLPALSENLDPITAEEAVVGDVVLMRSSDSLLPIHLGILTDQGLIHASFDRQKVVETGIDDSLKSLFVSWYRFR